MAFDITPFRHLSLAFDPIFRDRGDTMEGPSQYYVQDAHEDFRKALSAPLRLGDEVKLLIAGQPGCGKTTLLLDIAREFRASGRLVVFVDMELVTAVQELGPAEMHLAVLAGLLRETERTQRQVADEIRRRCQGWLRELTSADDVPVDSSGLHRRIHAVLNAARSSAAIRNELRRLVTGGEDKDPFSLVSALLSELAADKPLLILDGLDKLPPDQAKTFFLEEKRKPMVEAPGSAVLTIPLSIVYEPTFNVLSERYMNAENAVLPALRLKSMVQKDGGRWGLEPSPKGLELLRRIVRTRIEQAQVPASIVEEDAVGLAIESSGGNLRELARLMQASVVKAVVRESAQVMRQDVEAAIADQRESFGRVYQERFLPVLQRVRDEHQLDNLDEVGKLLLYGLWVVEYRNGVVWYDLPLPVRRLVEQRERLRT